jgi:hypothetical protein
MVAEKRVSVGTYSSWPVGPCTQASAHQMNYKMTTAILCMTM